MNKKKLLGIAALVVLVVVMGILYTSFKEKPVEGGKAITIEVVDSKGESTMYELNTDAKYLAQAMDEANGLTCEAEDGPYDLTVMAVNGERAVFDENGAYWGFSVNGEYCNYGISEQPVEDGDAFQIVYTPAE